MKKIKIEIKNRFTGTVIFEYESEGNTIKETVIEAVKSRADLSGADLSCADLSGADLSGALNSEFAIASTRILPEGDIIGYKKAYDPKKKINVIVKILIPKEAKRSSAFGRKCRAEYADVLEIEGAKKAVSSYDSNFVYQVGKRVTPMVAFDENFYEECSSGIHFFITRLEAEKY